MPEQGYEALCTAAEMRAGRGGVPGLSGHRDRVDGAGGRRVAAEAMQATRSARRFAVVCGGGSNGGDGRIAAPSCARRGWRRSRPTVEGCDVVIDALFGTGFHGCRGLQRPR